MRLFLLCSNNLSRRRDVCGNVCNSGRLQEGEAMRKLLVAVVAGLALTVPAPTGAATHTVRIVKAGFSPSALTIDFGSTVVWRNADTVNHQVVADTGAFASPILRPNQTYSFTFRTAGTFRYRDALEPAERGRITVKGPPPSLTLGASAPIVVAGTQITLTGVVSTRKAGEQVTLYHVPYGQTSLIQLAVVLTGTGGGYSYIVTPSILTSYEARWSSAISAQVAVQVKPKVAFLPRGQRFYAKVFAPGASFARRLVYLQRRSTFGQWVTVRKLALGPSSGRIFSIPRLRGSVIYRIYLTVNQAGAGYLDAASGTQRVRGVRRR
jgi:plastocyanin